MRSSPTLGNSRQNPSINNHLLFLLPHLSSSKVAEPDASPKSNLTALGNFTPDRIPCPK